jgi:hypothetical protein
MAQGGRRSAIRHVQRGEGVFKVLVDGALAVSDTPSGVDVGETGGSQHEDRIFAWSED